MAAGLESVPHKSAGKLVYTTVYGEVIHLCPIEKKWSQFTFRKLQMNVAEETLPTLCQAHNF